MENPIAWRGVFKIGNGQTQRQCNFAYAMPDTNYTVAVQVPPNQGISSSCIVNNDANNYCTVYFNGSASGICTFYLFVFWDSRSFGCDCDCVQDCGCNCSEDCGCNCSQDCGCNCAEDCGCQCAEDCGCNCGQDCMCNCPENCGCNCPENCGCNCTENCGCNCTEDCGCQCMQDCGCNCAENCGCNCPENCGCNCGEDCGCNCGQDCGCNCGQDCGCNCTEDHQNYPESISSSIGIAEQYVECTSDCPSDCSCETDFMTGEMLHYKMNDDQQANSLGSNEIAHYYMDDNAATNYVADSVGGYYGMASTTTDNMTTAGVVNTALGTGPQAYCVTIPAYVEPVGGPTAAESTSTGSYMTGDNPSYELFAYRTNLISGKRFYQPIGSTATLSSSIANDYVGVDMLWSTGAPYSGTVIVRYFGSATDYYDIGNSVSYFDDGTSNWSGTTPVDWGTTPPFDFGTGDFAIAWWDNRVWSSENGQEAAISEATGSAAFILGYHNSGYIDFYVAGSSGWQYTYQQNAPADYAWTHWIVTRKSGTIMVYRDGELLTDSIASAPDSIPPMSVDLDLLRGQGAYITYGAMDDVRFYNTWIGTDAARVLYSGTQSDGTTIDGKIITDALNNFNGTPQQVTDDISTVGQICKAITFNGTSDDVSFSISSAPTTNMSFCAWLNMQDQSGHFNWAFHKGGSQDGEIGLSVMADPQDGRYLTPCWSGRFGTGNWGDNWATTAGPAFGSWHHYAWTYDGSHIRFYVDGALLGSPVAMTGDISGTWNTCWLGREASWDSQRYKGAMDDVRLYNITLKAGQIANLYNGGAGTEVDTCPSD